MAAAIQRPKLRAHALQKGHDDLFLERRGLFRDARVAHGKRHQRANDGAAGAADAMPPPKGALTRMSSSRMPRS